MGAEFERVSEKRWISCPPTVKLCVMDASIPPPPLFGTALIATSRETAKED